MGSFFVSRGFVGVKLMRAPLLTLIVLATTPCVSRRIQAPTQIAHWSFDTPSITQDVTGILTATDLIGGHYATRTNAAAGVLPIHSVAGRGAEGRCAVESPLWP
jgi:hypothetical protein